MIIDASMMMLFMKSEITNLLTEIKELKLNLNESQRIIDLKEKEVKKTQEMVIQS